MPGGAELSIFQSSCNFVLTHTSCLHAQVQKRILAPNPTRAVGSDGDGIRKMEVKLRLKLDACIASGFPADQWPVQVSEYM